MIKQWQIMSAPLPAGPPVIADDPGLNTGLGILLPNGHVEAFEGTDPEAQDYIESLLQTKLKGTKPVLVVERFVISQSTVSNSQAPWSLEGIGAVKNIARRYGLEVVLQMPVEAKKFSTNPRLKAQGWYIPTPGGHVNDGLRHLYLYLCKNHRLVPPEGVI